LYKALCIEALYKALHEALRIEALYEVLYMEALHEAPHKALRTEALHNGSVYNGSSYDSFACDGSVYNGSTTEALYKSFMQSFVRTAYPNNNYLRYSIRL